MSNEHGNETRRDETLYHRRARPRATTPARPRIRRTRVRAPPGRHARRGPPPRGRGPVSPPGQWSACTVRETVKRCR